MAFWDVLKNVGKLALGFVPGGPIIGAGLAGAASGYGVGKAIKAARGAGTSQTSQTSMDINRLLEQSKSLSERGGAEYQAGLDVTAPAKSFYSKILGGSREAAQEALGPEISTILGQYDTAAASAAELGGRGGGRTRTLAEIPTLKAGVYGRALQSVRPTAAAALAGIGEREAALGAEREARGLATSSDLLRTRIAEAGELRREKREGRKDIAELGTGIGSLLTNILLGRKK